MMIDNKGCALLVGMILALAGLGYLILRGVQAVLS